MDQNIISLQRRSKCHLEPKQTVRLKTKRWALHKFVLYRWNIEELTRMSCFSPESSRVSKTRRLSAANMTARWSIYTDDNNTYVYTHCTQSKSILEYENTGSTNLHRRSLFSPNRDFLVIGSDYEHSGKRFSRGHKVILYICLFNSWNIKTPISVSTDVSGSAQMISSATCQCARSVSNSHGPNDFSCACSTHDDKIRTFSIS